MFHRESTISPTSVIDKPTDGVGPLKLDVRHTSVDGPFASIARSRSALVIQSSTIKRLVAVSHATASAFNGRAPVTTFWITLAWPASIVGTSRIRSFHPRMGSSE